MLALIFLAACGSGPTRPTTDPISQWPKLAADLIHDPTAPGLDILQQPGEALAILPRRTQTRTFDRSYQIDWNEAIDDGSIAPRDRLDPEHKPEILDLDIFLDLNGAFHVVRFPHKSHTEWLGCNSCHDQIFKRKAGTSGTSMSAMIHQDKFCAVCHGKVAFPLTECGMCHNTPWDEWARLRSPDNPHLKRQP